MDIELFWNANKFSADFKIVNGQFANDHDIKTALLISLFTDRRAENDDPLPSKDSTRRGWWGDAFMSRRIGSRLWLLSREKKLNSILIRAKEYATEAVQWMIEDKIAESVAVETEAINTDVLAIAVTVKRNSKPPEKYKFDYAWRGIQNVRN